MSTPRILIVEDERIVALSIQMILERLGYEVVGSVVSGQEAIQQSIEAQPDLVLMDIMLEGGTDGIDAASEIWTQLNIPIIYLTANSDVTTLQRAKGTEPFGYLLKPFNEQELYTTIETAIYKHQIDKQVKENAQWLSTVLNSIGDAIITTDNQGCITFMNPIAETLTGWSQVESLEQELTKVFKVIGTESKSLWKNLVIQAPQKDIMIALPDDALLLTKDGQQRSVGGCTTLIIDDKGNFSGRVLAFHDISERKQMEETLRQYTAKLETHNKELDAFAHTVAHDLKNPLNIIISYVEMLKNYTDLSEQTRQEYLHLVGQGGRKMAKIIDELLLLAKIRQRDVKRTPLDMGSIIQEVERRLSYLIEEAQAKIVWPELWPTVLGYGPWIEEVWVNYLSNAIKYGGHPPYIKLGATEQADNMVRFWVADNGLGLTPEEQARLFTPFERLNVTSTQGHGLGLSIVQQIVTKLGGEVGVISEGVSGRGSIFSFTLPHHTR